MTFEMDDNIYKEKVIIYHDYALNLIENEFENLLENKKNIKKDEIDFFDKKLNSLVEAFYAIKDSLIRRGL